MTFEEPSAGFGSIDPASADGLDQPAPTTTEAARAAGGAPASGDQKNGKQPNGDSAAGGKSLVAPHRRREGNWLNRLGNVVLLRFWRSMSWLLGHVPPGPAYTVGGWLAMVGYAASPSRRRWIRGNAGHVLGVAPTDKQAGKLARAMYRNYVRYVIELMRLPWLMQREREPMVEVDGIEPALELWRSSNGIILVAPHMGNNEAAAAGLAEHGLPVSVVGDDTAFEGLYELLKRQRESWGLHLISWRNLRAMYGVLKRHEMLGLLVDWGYRPDGIPVRFFGAWTTLPSGPAVLAARHGSAILPFIVNRVADDRFRLRLGQPIYAKSGDPPELVRATQAIADQLEAWIAESPEQWYIFKPIWPETSEEAERLAISEPAAGGRATAQGGKVVE